MNRDDRLAELMAERAATLQEARAAAAALSSSVFNRPEAHDAFRASPTFMRWQSSRERIATLEARIARLRQADGGDDARGASGLDGARG